MKSLIAQKKINMMKWAKDLFPIPRSLTGKGNEETFKYIIKNINKKFKIKYVKSNTKVFDWKIPLQWEISDAYIKLPNGKKICQFSKNNLHLVNYSSPIKKLISYKDLKKKIYFIKEKPNAIPYVTSYYKKNWGFCMTYNQFQKLPKKGKYEISIDSKIFNGKMGSMDLMIPGKSKKEILITSYICHPSMANNELSGPLIIMALSKILKKSYYSVRLLLIPETIGAINYINKNFKSLQKNLIAGFNITCVGDGGPVSYVRSKDEVTYADKIAKRVLKKFKHKSISFLNRGSNERQFGCQNLKLPYITITRNSFGNYKEYHTSLDNLDFINQKNLLHSLKAVCAIINEIQKNRIFIKKNYCELFLTKHNLMDSTGFVYKKNKKISTREISNILAYADKNNDSTELSKICKISLKKFNDISKDLIKLNMIQIL
jgi:aminopeptidase-like protein